MGEVEWGSNYKDGTEPISLLVPYERISYGSFGDSHWWEFDDRPLVGPRRMSPNC
jgi:hypothetical protein